MVTWYPLLHNKVSHSTVTVSSSLYIFYHSSSVMFLHDSVRIRLYLKILYLKIIRGLSDVRQQNIKYSWCRQICDDIDYRRASNSGAL